MLRHAGTVLLLGSDMRSTNMLTAAPEMPGLAVSMLDVARAMAIRLRPDVVCAPMLNDQQYEWVRSAFPACGPPASETSEAYLDLCFESFDGYIAGLPASWRAKRRKERRRFLESGLDLRVTPPSTVATGAAPLLAQVEQKYGAAGAVIQREWSYLTSTAVAMGRHGSALVAEQDGRLVAFSVVWDTGRHWRVRCWGCDYGAPVVRESFAYFNLVVYEPLIRATAAGVCRLVLGTGSLPAKLERGAAVRRLRSLCWEVTAS
jgi:predicted N-acyltransferase